MKLMTPEGVATLSRLSRISGSGGLKGVAARRGQRLCRNEPSARLTTAADARLTYCLVVITPVIADEAGVLIELGPAIGKSGGSLEITVGMELDGPQSTNGVKAVSAAIPRVEVTFPETQWLIATTGFGSLLGGLSEGHFGALVGGAAGYLWGRWRWSRVNR